uniref:Uncharacterized protein n=1 Tax=Moniliophthora roreri TaxID=221103 RepID=A0A0W0FTR7_MONRR
MSDFAYPCIISLARTLPLSRYLSVLSLWTGTLRVPVGLIYPSYHMAHEYSKPRNTSSTPFVLRIPSTTTQNQIPTNPSVNVNNPILAPAFAQVTI